MPKNREDSCTHAIQNYLEYGINKKINKTELLNNLILYYLGHQGSNTLINESTEKPIVRLKAYCDAKDQITRSAFISSLTSICYKLSECNKFGAESPSELIASFDSASKSSGYKPFQYNIDLAWLTRLSPEMLDVLLFCLKTYAPDISIIGDFVDNPPLLNTLKKVLTNLKTPVLINYECKTLAQIGCAEMPVFLLSVSKARALELDDIQLQKWTPDDFKHFVQEVTNNPNLTSLSLTNTNLKECCGNPRKFGYLLKLIGLPQIKSLNLHYNRLGSLPEPQLKILEEAIDNSPIEHIGLTHVKRKNKGSPGTNGIFSRSTQAQSDKVNAECWNQVKGCGYYTWGPEIDN